MAASSSATSRTPRAQWPAAKRYLEAFLKRTDASRPALGIALEGEVKMTKATLAKMSAN